MGMLAGLLLADSCDDVNDEHLPGGKYWRENGFQNPVDFVRELENYRKSLCDESKYCIWRPGKRRPGEIIRGVCEKRFDGDGNGNIPISHNIPRKNEIIFNEK